MPLIDKKDLLPYLRKRATNSSHFVWGVANMKYYQTANDWIFAYVQRRDVTLIALEPLIPEAPTHFTEKHRAEFSAAWKEFTEATRSKTCAFISINSPFVDLISQEGFRALKVGQEPWVDLSDCIPKGNAGKGVRQARNHAIKAGLQVEEWSADEIRTNPIKQETIHEILKQWQGGRLIELDGFLNSVDPFEHMNDRRYFVISSPRRVEAFLITTPIPGLQSYFLEDMIIRRDAPNGCGELLTLEAMVALNESHGKEASLGVVSMNTLGDDSRDSLSAPLKLALKALSRIARLFYNTGGLEVYRRRFRPHKWQSIYVAVKPAQGTSETASWFKIFWALLWAFQPHFQITREWLANSIRRPFKRYGFTLALGAISTLLFIIINHGGDLPKWALDDFGFAASKPVSEWPYRSLFSDFLYFNRMHFLLCSGLFLVVVGWCERCHRRSFVIGFVIASIFLDDVVNYYVIIKPFEYFQPEFFRRMIHYKDVGSSLIITSILGLQIPQFRRFREILFAVTSFFIVMLFLLQRQKLEMFALDVNHFLFFTVGFISGKVKFEVYRRQSKLAAKGKPPVGKTVAPAVKKQRVAAEEQIAVAQEKKAS